jgi:hypothetical protein
LVPLSYQVGAGHQADDGHGAEREGGSSELHDAFAFRNG